MRLLFLSVAVSCLALGAQAQSAQQKFEEATKRVAFFDIGEFVWNRPDTFWKAKDPVAFKASQEALAEAVKAPLTHSELTGELKNPDPRVRTLALANLFAREDPHDLPQIVALDNDYAPTLPGHGELSPDWLRITGIGPPPENQTVHDIVEKMADFYLSRAGFSFKRARVQNIKLVSDFQIYWEERKDRAFCASWFAVKLARASRGTSPTQPEYVPDIRRVRAAIDALPRADRNWTLLYLNGESGSDALASDAEFQEAAKELGPTQLERLLENQPVSTDPDLRPMDLLRMKMFVLQNARLFLLPSQADALLAQEKRERVAAKNGASNPFLSPLWFVAAAELDPRNARVILQTGWAGFQDRFDAGNQTTLAVAIAERGDHADWPFLLAWLFAPKPKGYDGSDSMGRQSNFISLLDGGSFMAGNRSVRRPLSPALRQLLARIVNDPRFDASDVWAVLAALEAVNASQPDPVADVQQFYEEGRSGPAAQSAIAAMKVKLRATSAAWSR